MTAPATDNLLRIPLEQIAVVDRARHDMGDLQELADDFLQIDQTDDGPRQRGQLQPGVVCRATEWHQQKFGVDLAVTPWVLVAGGRRYAALNLAGIDTFLAVDRGELPPLLQRIYELHENLFRKDLSWTEKVFLNEEIHKARVEEASSRGEEWSQKDSAAEYHTSHATISRDLEMAEALRANPELAKEQSQAAAVRKIKYQQSIEQRTARVNQTSLIRVKDKLQVADMRQFTRALPDNLIDLCFTDFKFGIDYDFDPTDANKYEDSQDSLRDLLTDVIPQIIRVTKPTGWLALMMGSTNYEMLRDLVQTCCAEHYEYADVTWRQDAAGDWIRERKQFCSSPAAGRASPCRFLTAEDPEWIWYRPNSRNPSKWPELHAQNQYEKFCVVNMGEAVMVRKNEGNVLMHDAIYEDRIHEMQRPHPLCLDVISRLTVGGELVADFCFGSGSALAAAAELQRDFLGCDINPKCLEPALMWVSEHMPQ